MRLSNLIMVLAVILTLGIVASVAWFSHETRQARLNGRLITAVDRHDVREVTRILDQGAKADTREGYIPAPPWTERFVSQLLHRPVPQPRMGSPVLLFAAFHRDGAVVRVLLEHGADANIGGEIVTDEADDTDTNVTPLMGAANNADVPTMLALIHSGADVNARDDEDGSVLRWAAGDTKAVRLLASHGADVNEIDKGGETPLICALQSQGDNPEIIQAYLDAGAAINARNDDGETALMVAASNCLPRCVRILLTHGADAIARDSKGRSILTYGTDFAQDGNGDQLVIARLLKGAGAKP